MRRRALSEATASAAMASLNGVCGVDATKNEGGDERWRRRRRPLPLQVDDDDDEDEQEVLAQEEEAEFVLDVLLTWLPDLADDDEAPPANKSPGVRCGVLRADDEDGVRLETS